MHVPVMCAYREEQAVITLTLVTLFRTFHYLLRFHIPQFGPAVRSFFTYICFSSIVSLLRTALALPLQFFLRRPGPRHASLMQSRVHATEHRRKKWTSGAPCPTPTPSPRENLNYLPPLYYRQACIPAVSRLIFLSSHLVDVLSGF